ncbi:MAG: glycoside hydrolase family 88 protein [Pirellulales bacterium]|nr:glycoside hydrolase family 88 protein [Pirellulales bacterium]
MPLLLTAAQRASYCRAVDFAAAQFDATVRRWPDYFPAYTTAGRWHHAGELWTDWTGGFLAGAMWQLERHTGDEVWRQRAERYSRLLEPRQHDRAVHDLGFVFLNTYRPWYERTGDPRLQAVLLTAARTLALRFRERGQYLCSFIGPQSLFIDIMMNVPLIFYGAQATGDAELLRVAEAHCRTTRDRIVRADGSTAHEGLFDLESGAFLGESTHQGLRGDSRWARGLAWSLYGYSQCYALTGNDEWREVAERNAAFWLARLPADGVPYWDFDADLSAPLPWGPQKDSSAAAIAASGLLHLAGHSSSEERAEPYRTTALRMLDALTGSEYLAAGVPGWEGSLRHGVYHTAKGLGVDESVMWGEFFFLEGLLRALDGD